MRTSNSRKLGLRGLSPLRHGGAGAGQLLPRNGVTTGMGSIQRYGDYQLGEIFDVCFFCSSVFELEIGISDRSPVPDQSRARSAAQKRSERAQPIISTFHSGYSVPLFH